MLIKLHNGRVTFIIFVLIFTKEIRRCLPFFTVIPIEAFHFLSSGLEEGDNRKAQFLCSLGGRKPQVQGTPLRTSLVS